MWTDFCNVRTFADIQVNNWVHVLKAIFTLDTDIFLKGLVEVLQTYVWR